MSTLDWIEKYARSLGPFCSGTAAVPRQRHYKCTVFMYTVGTGLGRATVFVCMLEMKIPKIESGVEQAREIMLLGIGG